MPVSGGIAEAVGAVLGAVCTGCGGGGAELDRSTKVGAELGCGGGAV